MAKAKKKKPPFLPLPSETKELCMQLAGIAAFHVQDPKAQAAIYKAVRTLQQLDAAAIEAGILPNR